MDPILRAAQDRLGALLKEKDALVAKATAGEAIDMERVKSLTDDIQNAQSDVEALVKLSGLSASANDFLTGQRTLNPVASASPIRDPEEERKKPVIRGRARHFSDQMTAYRFGKFAQAALLRRADAINYCKSNGIPLMAGQNESVNEDGGFLVPEEFQTDMIKLLERYGVFRNFAKFKPMASDTLTRPRRTGGVTAYWVDEGEAATESDADWDRVRLTAKKLMVRSRITSEINEDATVNMADELMFEISYAFAQKEDRAGFVGDGTSTHGRIVGAAQRLFDVYTATGGVGLKLGAGNAYSELTRADFSGTKALLPDFADNENTRWFCHRSFYYEVMESLALAVGGVTFKEFSDGGPPRLLGYNVEFVNAMPKVAANSQVCALLGDMYHAADFGESRATTIAMSEHALFSTDEIAVRGTERVDINVHDVGNATLAGPIVGLVLAAS